MAPKATRIADVHHPEKVAPGSSSRPVLVTNRPVLMNDPMMVSAPKPDGEAVAPTEPLTRTAKVITPVDPMLAGLAPAEPEPPKPSASLEVPPEAAEVPATAEAVTADEPKRDSDAEITAQESAAQEAQAARQQELEGFIASGKYHLPINAAQRKRSRMYTAMLCVLALLLAVLLFDAVLDAGFVTAPVKLPHTHFFSS